MQQTTAVLISITGLDKVGLVSSVTGYLFDTGANLADTAYAVLGGGFELTCIAEYEIEINLEAIKLDLASQPELNGATINISLFPYQLLRGDSGSITHIVEVTGGDRPGLIAHISDVLGDYQANIVRMNSRRIEKSEGMDYRTRFAISAGSDRFKQLEAALYNTAGSLGLDCSVETIAR